MIQSCCGVTAIGPSLPAEPSVGVTQQCWGSTEPKAWSFQTDSGSRPACTTGCGGRRAWGPCSPDPAPPALLGPQRLHGLNASVPFGHEGLWLWL